MNKYDIKNFGGRGDGHTDNTESFAAAFQAIKEAGGGTLLVGKGVWRTGPMRLFSHTTLYLSREAVVSFIPEPARYPPVWTRWEGVECFAMHPCLFAEGQEDIAVKGKGALDGNGQFWWDALREKRLDKQDSPQTPEELALAKLNREYKEQPSGGGGRCIQFLRPPLVQFLNCSKIRMKGITLCNSPFWTVHPVYCAGVSISGLVIRNPRDAPNTDGIDIDSCEDVLIENCRVAVGDDGIAVKSGAGEDGIRVAKPCRRVTVRGCTFIDGHGGIVIGSETAAGISDVLAEDCLFRGTDRGIRIKTRRGRGGKIQDMEFRRLTMENNLCPLTINMYYRCGASMEDGFFSREALPVNSATPSIRNISITDLHASGCRASAGFIAGLPESPVENISLRRLKITTDEKSGVSPDEAEMFLGLPQASSKSIRMLNILNIELNDIHIDGPKDSFIYN